MNHYNYMQCNCNLRDILHRRKILTKTADQVLHSLCQALYFELMHNTLNIIVLFMNDFLKSLLIALQFHCQSDA